MISLDKVREVAEVKACCDFCGLVQRLEESAVSYNNCLGEVAQSLAEAAGWRRVVLSGGSKIWLCPTCAFYREKAKERKPGEEVVEDAEHS